MAGLPEAVVHRTPRIQRIRGRNGRPAEVASLQGERPTAEHPPAPALGRNDEDATGLSRRSGRATSLSGRGNRRWLPSGWT
ncbi:hypothetical protein CSB93_4860 [Pseudomonas paraeruginosa]|uniref:Uncharacterized protein n=1 Tax=Pseudomonas paraeruginosa TaxID=2994495 RepID=A0A2R3IRC5_9PSED|nr:hypothetical protein CSB93_4860 [Pseudomonas paraeruginosa]AWE91426.1 hypothetical protein CSC28_3650 [Pseudomonas paraeruginosa]PTC35888.1 hypothetical protein CLJ1_3373 [Pseudomonas aeruginosa]